ncbi:MAG: WYL domain-containing protein [Lentisphaerota bacterium]|jgi:predicted DNA-binding transcriptional regulator YafY
MPVNKKQLLRLIRLVSELKQNRYPNCQSFADKLLKAEDWENLNIACNAKTIQRDIRTLKADFGAPIEFDHQNNGFYLTHHGWDFLCPPLQDEEMMAAVFGAKVAEDIFPEPVKSQIRNAVDTQLAGNNPDVLDTAFIKTLIVASGVKVEINPEIFKTVFDAWQGRNALDIKYRAPDGTITERCVEPHVLTYFNEAWYIKGYCVMSNATRIFAIHRIQSAEITDKTFEPDKKIINGVINGDVYDFDKVKDVEIWLTPEAANYAKERKRKKDEKLTFNKDGSAVLYLPEAVPFDIIRWMMSECGRAKVLKPADLAKEIAKAADLVAEVHRK